MGRRAWLGGLTAGAGCALALALSGCGHSPPTKFYTLDPAPAAAPRIGGPIAPVKLQAVHFPPEFDRPQLVTRGGAPGQLQVHETSHWAGPVGQLARNALTLDLASRLPGGAIIAPDSPRPAGTRLLTVDVLEIVVAGGETRMTAVWTLAAPPPLKGPPPAAVSRTETVSAASGGANDASAQAQTFTRLLAALADRIAPDLAG
ncbi:MAG TPA: PqiC family protein [Caulobacteraceae bacterium]|jgi:hypothetical protein|nr:PqiC family protein [Caulobacteraceae bacterium]